MARAGVRPRDRGSPPPSLCVWLSAVGTSEAARVCLPSPCAEPQGGTAPAQLYTALGTHCSSTGKDAMFAVSACAQEPADADAKASTALAARDRDRDVYIYIAREKRKRN